MITLKVENYNPITPDFYNDTISKLQFHQLTCTCGHSGCLSIHGYYNRYIKNPDGKIRFRICRVKCKSCGRTHALLLSSFVPFSQISFQDHSNLISCFEDGRSPGAIMDLIPTIDESNYRYIIRQYLRHWKQRLLSERIHIRPITLLVSRCFMAFSRQFMQIKNTPNILFVNTT